MAKAEIHWIDEDEEGKKIKKFYYKILNDKGDKALTDLTGPYDDVGEAEAQALNAKKVAEDNDL